MKHSVVGYDTGFLSATAVIKFQQ